MDTNTDTPIAIGSLDFTPDWAKKSAGVNIGNIRPARDEDERRDDRSGEKRRDDRRGDRRNEKRRDDRRGDRPFAPKPRFERPQPLDADVKVLPDSKALGTIIRKLQHEPHAYKLMDLVYFFLDNPESMLLKIEPRDGTPICQCKACSFASVKEEDVVAHLVSCHLSDYYDERKVEGEPPKGNFSSVAKCGLSGVLIGPPNMHDFNSAVREMIRTRYPGMREEEYRSRIEIVRDSDTIEEWRKQAAVRTLYFRKGAGEGDAGLSRSEAEGEFRRVFLPSLLDVRKSAAVTADKALSSPCRPLADAARRAIENARRAPHGMCYALHGAFHNRKMKFFRVNDPRGYEFVTGVELKQLDCEHAIPELRRIVDLLVANPCRTKQEIVQSPDDEKHLSWLVSTGHVVSFSNGVYSAVEKFPKYGPKWREARKEVPTAEPEEAPKPEVPVAEVPNEAAEVPKEVENEDTAKLD